MSRMIDTSTAPNNLRTPESIGGSMKVADTAVHPGEDSTFDRTWGGGLAKAVSLTADGQVGVAGPCIYYGHIVTTALSAAVVNVRDATAAGAGTIIDIIAASAAAGVTKNLATGIYCATGCYADFAGTGTVTFYYQQL